MGNKTEENSGSTVVDTVLIGQGNTLPFPSVSAALMTALRPLLFGAALALSSAASAQESASPFPPVDPGAVQERVLDELWGEVQDQTGEFVLDACQRSAACAPLGRLSKVATRLVNRVVAFLPFRETVTAIMTELWKLGHPATCVQVACKQILTAAQTQTPEQIEREIARQRAAMGEIYKQWRGLEGQARNLALVVPRSVFDIPEFFLSQVLPLLSRHATSTQEYRERQQLVAQLVMQVTPPTDPVDPVDPDPPPQPSPEPPTQPQALPTRERIELTSLNRGIIYPSPTFFYARSRSKEGVGPVDIKFITAPIPTKSGWEQMTYSQHNVFLRNYYPRKVKIHWPGTDRESTEEIADLNEISLIEAEIFRQIRHLDFPDTLDPHRDLEFSTNILSRAGCWRDLFSITNYLSRCQPALGLALDRTNNKLYYWFDGRMTDLVPIVDHRNNLLTSERTLTTSIDHTFDPFTQKFGGAAQTYAYQLHGDVYGYGTFTGLTTGDESSYHGFFDAEISLHVRSSGQRRLEGTVGGFKRPNNGLALGDWQIHLNADGTLGGDAVSGSWSGSGSYFGHELYLGNARRQNDVGGDPTIRGYLDGQLSGGQFVGVFEASREFISKPPPTFIDVNLNPIDTALSESFANDFANLQTERRHPDRLLEGWGAWIDPQNPSGRMRDQVSAWFDGPAGSPAQRDVHDYSGTGASINYSGNVQGLYSDSSETPGQAGRFSADISLTANFGTQAGSPVGIGGTVSNYRNETGEVLSWLNAAILSSNGRGTVAVNNNDVGDFHVQGVGDTGAPPDHLVGYMTLQHDQIQAIGGFGAARDEDS
ncbi:MAG: hypothetical protein OXD33_05275 [Rhodobacteraceae bacterium]|nr:hypothetical protein [Paracoccaceae bacterium]